VEGAARDHDVLADAKPPADAVARHLDLSFDHVDPLLVTFVPVHRNAAAGQR